MGDALPYLLLIIAIAVPAAVLLSRGQRDGRQHAHASRRIFLYRGGRRQRRPVPADDESSQRALLPRVAAIGVFLVFGGLGTLLLLLDVTDRELTEERGVGVVPSALPEPGRGFAVSAAVEVRSCDNPVTVTLVVTGTAEYWIDHAEDMLPRGTLRVAVPDLRLSNVEFGLGTDGKLGPIAPFTEEPEPDSRIRALPTHGRELRTVTELGVEVDDWGHHLRPVVFRFDAPWLSRRDHFGTCFLKLPALAGPSTVLSAQELEGRVAEQLEDVPCPCTILPISSQETGLTTYYQPELETSRAVTASVVGENTIRTDLSVPAPDGNVRGIPSWTCGTRPVHSFEILERVKEGARDPELIQGGSVGDATGAQSIDRLGKALSERTCASSAVIEEPNTQIKRDLILLVFGGLVSLGIASLVELVSKRRRDAP